MFRLLHSQFISFSLGFHISIKNFKNKIIFILKLGHIQPMYLSFWCIYLLKWVSEFTTTLQSSSFTHFWVCDLFYLYSTQREWESNLHNINFYFVQSLVIILKKYESKKWCRLPGCLQCARYYTTTTEYRTKVSREFD